MAFSYERHCLLYIKTIKCKFFLFQYYLNCLALKILIFIFFWNLSYVSIYNLQAQIHLLGNLAVWYTGTICVVLYSALLVFYLLRRRRRCYDIPEGNTKSMLYLNNLALIISLLFCDYYNFLIFFIITETWNKYVTVGEVLLGGYLCHFLPFFFCDRTLFLHHYLPAYAYKIMLSAFVVTHIYHVMR